MKELDDLGQRARNESTVQPPTKQWLNARLAERQRRRRIVAVVGCLVLAGSVFAVIRSSDSPTRTEVVATASSDDDQTSSTRSTTTIEPVTDETGPVDPDGDPEDDAGPRSSCGPWPTAVELWPGQNPTPPVDTIDDDGRVRRQQSVDGYAIEVLWPPADRADYDLDFVFDEDRESGFWSTTDGGATQLGISADASSTDPAAVFPPGPQFALVSSDDPTLSALDGACANFEFRVFEGGQLIEHVALGFGPLGQQEEITTEDGRTITFDAGFDWLDVNPIVVERRSVGSIPQSGRCDGVLVDVAITTYRIDGPVRGNLTLAEAIATGHLTEITDPSAESLTAGPAETWAVVLPGAPSGSTIRQLNEQGVVQLIDAASYENFVDPETGPTFGPGVDGAHAEPIEALRAFFDHPAAETFITSGLVELIIDDDTIAYGVPEGHGGDGWITVITVERANGVWLVTGWTSAGC